MWASFLLWKAKQVTWLTKSSLARSCKYEGTQRSSSWNSFRRCRLLMKFQKEQQDSFDFAFNIGHRSIRGLRLCLPILFNHFAVSWLYLCKLQFESFKCLWIKWRPVGFPGALTRLKAIKSQGPQINSALQSLPPSKPLYLFRLFDEVLRRLKSSSLPKAEKLLSKLNRFRGKSISPQWRLLFKCF